MIAQQNVSSCIYFEYSIWTDMPIRFACFSEIVVFSLSLLIFGRKREKFPHYLSIRAVFALYWLDTWFQKLLIRCISFLMENEIDLLDKWDMDANENKLFKSMMDLINHTLLILHTNKHKYDVTNTYTINAIAMIFFR